MNYWHPPSVVHPPADGWGRVLFGVDFLILYQGHAMPRGGKRPGAGRPKGAKDKIDLRTQEELWAYIAEQGARANPFKRLVDRLVRTRDAAVEIQCALALADRLLPKLKAVEHTGKAGGPIDYREVPAAERQQRIQDLLAKRNGHAVPD